MLGDSITEWAGNWSKLLDSSKEIINQGISGNTGVDILARMDEIYFCNPDFVFIMFGINDIFQGYDIGTIFSNYQKILQKLEEKTKAQILIQSTLYIFGSSPEFKEVNKSVTRLDEKLQSYSQENAISFLNLNEFLSKDEMLRADCSVDGVHLSQFAYSLWAKTLKDTFSEIFK